MIYEVIGLNYSYNKKDKVLSNIDLEINEGELLCVLGKNGAGKSTLFSCLLGLLKADAGSIYLKGQNLSNLKERDIARLVGYVPQNSMSTFNISVFDYIMMGCASRLNIFSKPGKHEVDLVNEAIEILGLGGFLNRGFNELSGGEKQKVAIARAIVNKPEILVFDEPTAHLDYGNQIKVLKMIKDLSLKGYSILVSTHDPNHSTLLNGNVALLNDKGEIEKGSLEEILTEEKLKNIYGYDLNVRYLDEFKRNVFIYPWI